jgi:hypothetical protein
MVQAVQQVLQVLQQPVELQVQVDLQVVQVHLVLQV